VKQRIHRLRPSPAMVVAVIALFLSLGGVSYGIATIGTRQIKNNSVRSTDIRNRTIRNRDVHRNALTGSRIRESTLGTVPTSTGLSHFAVVSSAGIVARSRGLSSATRTGTGRYQVIFNRDVRSCAYVSTQGSVGAVVPPSGMITVASLASNVNGVEVHTFSGNGNFANRSFHLLVNC
jgi:hypothetical protein